MSGTRAKDLSGQVFGRLTVLDRAGSSPNRVAIWNTVCECGSQSTKRADRLLQGRTTSCGCMMAKPFEPGNQAAVKEVVTYRSAHSRVWATKGKASDHSCVDCGGPASEWSYTYTDEYALYEDSKGFYSLSPEHYTPRCKGCHVIFDAT